MTDRKCVWFALFMLPFSLAWATHTAPMSASELAARLGDNNAPLILDVRSEREFESGHIPGALNIPYDQLPQNLSELDSGQKGIVVYCEVGGRARVAHDFLESAGYARVRNLQGHMRNWRAGGYPQE